MVGFGRQRARGDGARGVAVERRDLSIRAEASGQIEPLRVVEVKSRVAGELRRITVEKHSALLVEYQADSVAAVTELLDDLMPIVAGSEVNDNPFAPVSRYARKLIDVDKVQAIMSVWASAVSIDSWARALTASRCSWS